MSERLCGSRAFFNHKDRVDLLPFLEDLFDSNDTVFKYNEKKNSFSMIKADYLMKNRLVDKNVFIFLSKGKDDTYFCRSFFPEANRDYTKNQASWTLLYMKILYIDCINAGFLV